MLHEAITEEQIRVPSYSADEIHSAQMHERSAAVAVVLMGFSNDPVARWVYPNPEDYLNYFSGFIRAFAGRSFDAGTAYLTDEMSGAALWLPPGIEPDAETLEVHFDATVQDSIKSDLDVFLGQMAAFHPTEPHWYLPMIGVDPRFQGKGIGSRLMRYALSECDQQGLPAYLESSNRRNITLYERFGFSVIGTIQVGSSPPMYPMFRKAL